MFDKQIFAWTEKPAVTIAAALRRRGIGADRLTLAGFAAGLAALPLLAGGHYLWALLFILLNRLCDGLDGVVARLDRTSDRGAFLDVALDFFFYASVPFGFALADPEANALAAAFLLFGFIGTGSSFLALAVLAERQGRRSADFPTKGIYYLGGLHRRCRDGVRLHSHVPPSAELRDHRLCLRRALLRDDRHALVVGMAAAVALTGQDVSRIGADSVRETASFQPAYLRARTASVMAGRKRRSSFQLLAKSSGSG